VALLYPLLVMAAIALIVRGRDAAAGRGEGWPWFWAWAACGGLLLFSFLTGFSIGLFILPFAAVLLVWTARQSPHAAEALGFLTGVGVVLLLLSDLNDWRSAFITGIVLSLAGAFGYAGALTHRQRLHSAS
jgi:drug/metabolite transporter (DMT)-like permease